MKSRKKDTTRGSLLFSLGDTLNPQHPLYRLADKIDWQGFEDGFDSLYCADRSPGSAQRAEARGALRVEAEGHMRGDGRTRGGGI